MDSSDDSDFELAFFAYWRQTNIDKCMKRCVRRSWIHDTLKTRQSLGEYHRLVQELRLDSARFKKYFRMSPSVFDELLSMIGPLISKTNTNFRRPIDAGERLAITLR